MLKKLIGVAVASLFLVSVLFADVGKLAGQDITPTTKIAGVTGGKIAGQTIVSVGGDIEYGTPGIGSLSSLSQYGRWEPFTVAAGGVTISHGAVYCSSVGTVTISMAIFDTSGTPVLQGVCSDPSDSFASAPAWQKVTWSTPVVLSAGNYWFRYVIASGAANVTYYYDTDVSQTRMYGIATTDCTDANTTGTSDRMASMVVSNYDSKP